LITSYLVPTAAKNEDATEAAIADLTERRILILRHEGVYRKLLDLETLVATSGPNFPLSGLESRLMCPACGNRRLTIVFEPPTNSQFIG
jgi:hypothetical protein